LHLNLCSFYCNFSHISVFCEFFSVTKVPQTLLLKKKKNSQMNFKHQLVMDLLKRRNLIWADKVKIQNSFIIFLVLARSDEVQLILIFKSGSNYTYCFWFAFQRKTWIRMTLKAKGLWSGRKIKPTSQFKGQSKTFPSHLNQRSSTFAFSTFPTKLSLVQV
jgi:hypothetical protein